MAGQLLRLIRPKPGLPTTPFAEWAQNTKKIREEMPVQSERAPYETQLEPWPAIGAALLTVLKATWLVLRELVKLLWRLTAILVPLVLGALVNMVLWHFRNPPPHVAEDGNNRHWLDPGPCDVGDVNHPDWHGIYGDTDK